MPERAPLAVFLGQEPQVHETHNPFALLKARKDSIIFRRTDITMSEVP